MAARRRLGDERVAGGHSVARDLLLGAGAHLGWIDPAAAPLSLMAEVPAAAGSLPSLAKELEKVPEYRRPRGFRADQPPVLLIPTLLLLLVAALCGRLGYISIAEWGQLCARAEPEVLDALGFPRGRKPRTPAAATLFRMVRDMELAKFQEALEGWLQVVGSTLELKCRSGRGRRFRQIRSTWTAIGCGGRAIDGGWRSREERPSVGGGLCACLAGGPGPTGHRGQRA